MTSPFETNHQPPIGEVEQLAEGLQVVTANNAGAMTFTTEWLSMHQLRGDHFLPTMASPSRSASIIFSASESHDPLGLLSSFRTIYLHLQDQEMTIVLA